MLDCDLFSTINRWWRSYETSDIAKVTYQIFNAKKGKHQDPEKHKQVNACPREYDIEIIVCALIPI